MASIREQIMQAAVTAISTALVSVANVYRTPPVAITREQCPALAVVIESDEIDSRKNDRLERSFTIRLTALARAEANPEAESDSILTLAHAALFADRNFGGLALGIEERSCDWDIEDADATAAAMQALYAIQYRTMQTDLAAKG